MSDLEIVKSVLEDWLSKSECVHVDVIIACVKAHNPDDFDKDIAYDLIIKACAAAGYKVNRHLIWAVE